jgi:uncharacterized protein (TIGR03089 family)
VHQLIESPEGLFATIVAEQPSRPFVTFYDESSSERTELSAKSLANWVAKTYYLLIDELGLGVGDRAFVALPAHWLSVPALFGCWAAGLSLTSAARGAEVAFVEPGTVALATGIPDCYAIAPANAAQGFGAHAPGGTTDFITAVRPQPDAWASVRSGAGASDAGLDERSRGELVEAARRRADSLGLSAGARVLTTRPWRTPGEAVDALLLPLVVGGSLVIVANADQATVARRLQQERAVLSD